MKNHKQVKRRVSLYELEGPVSEISAYLLRIAEGLKEPVLEHSCGWYDDPDDLEIVGWVPMTEREIASAERKRKRDKERAALKRQEEKAREQARDLAEYERLQKKFAVAHPHGG